MFGYVVMNKPEIKFKDFDMYRSFYCGLCRELKERYGLSGQITLTYDMTFVILLLSGLYEPPTKKGSTRCIVHPVRRQPVRKNAITEYAADMNIFLTYYKCKDDWNDERSIPGLIFGKLLEGKEKKSEKLWSKKVQTIVSCLDELSALEKENATDIDRVSGCFGRIMSSDTTAPDTTEGTTSSLEDIINALNGVDTTDSSNIVRILGGRRMSVSGIIENIVRHHLSLYEEDFEAWRKL